MKKIIAILLSPVLFTAPFTFGDDVSQFSVRGVSPGMNVEEACASLVDDFPEESGLRVKVGLPARFKPGGRWGFSVDSSIREIDDNSNGCRGNFKGNDQEAGGAMTWGDNIEVFEKNGAVYAVKNNQTLAVGDNIEACHEKRESTMNALLSKYGKPTYLHGDDPAEKKDYRHLIWDYSKSPDSRFGDEGYEIYQVYIGCDTHHESNPFGRMQMGVELHSGNVFNTHAATAKIGASFEPTL